ncbi:MAG: thioredoxin domain-containing protein [Myxococcales bacterium]|nr:thioredoxin domain-containing protein [Myxococcales bacterium]
MRREVYVLGSVAAVLVVTFGVAAGLYLSSEKRAKSDVRNRAAAANPSRLERSHSHSLGPDDAKVTLVEFLDPECEACRAFHPRVKKLLSQYPKSVRLVLRYMPLHQNSVYAAGALEAAGEQNRFWEMLEVLFQNQPAWGNHQNPRPDLIPGFARQIGLDMAAFDRSMKAGLYRTLVEMDRSDGVALGVSGTPSFFVNGKPLVRLGYDPLRAMIEQEISR